MRTCHCVIAMAALAGAFLALPARAADGRPGKGLTEIPDSELNLMRGRYTVGDNAVAWFGVSMISTWQTASGQTLESTLALGMDFSRGDQPQVSFTPTVSITAANAPLPAVTDGVGRSVDGAGLDNVAGMAQSVQVAGDHNRASNLTHLNVRDGHAPPVPSGATSALLASGTVATRVGDAVARATFSGGAAGVLLQIEGQGAVQQWIRNGSLGQTIQLTSDHQQVSNRLQIDLVRQPLAANAMLAQNVAQALTMVRAIGPGQ